MIQYDIIEGYGVKPLTRGTPRSAGMDIYCPYFTQKFIEDFNKANTSLHNSRISSKHKRIEIFEFGSVLIPTGIKLHITPSLSYIEVCTKSGKFVKKGLKTGAHIIDSDYQGNVMISLFNPFQFSQFIEEGEALAQLIHIPCFIQDWAYMEESYESLPKTERGDGGFGSTETN